MMRYAGNMQLLLPFLAIRPGKGVQELAKPTQRFKVGIVTIQEGVTPKTKASYWLLRYVDPDTGHDVRRRAVHVCRVLSRQ